MQLKFQYEIGPNSNWKQWFSKIGSIGMPIENLIFLLKSIELETGKSLQLKIGKIIRE
jgi:hypothetical protein